MTSAEIKTVGEVFQLLVEIDYKGSSPLYERLGGQAVEDPELLSLMLPAAPNDRIPHLLFAAVQYLLLGEGSDPLAAFGDAPYGTFRSWCLDHRAEIEAIVATRYTQTNEVGRCAALLPCLATVSAAAAQPLAIIEVGASAGLNLLFDRYNYDYGPGLLAGDQTSDVVLRPRMDGDAVPPLTTPEVVWRRGVDRSPVDVGDEQAVRWLRSCIWPEQQWRIELFDRAVAAARRDPPVVVRGDAVVDLPALVAEAPRDAALCVMHTAVMPYLPDRARFVDLLSDLAGERPLWWISGEGQTLVPELPVPPQPPSVQGQIYFLYGVVPLGAAGAAGTAVATPRTLARAGSHGAWLEWLA
jgi:uncharacterized protein DUF2332